MDVSWWRYAYDHTSLPSTLLIMGFPWIFVIIYFTYYLFRRPREIPIETMSPFALFMNYLTDGATAGYDKPLMKLFHQDLLKNHIERGLLRAMARCVCKRLGNVVNIPRDTMVVKKQGDQVHLAALVDFEHRKQVKCRLSWTWSSSGEMFATKLGPMRRFYITAFRVEPQPKEIFDVLNFLCLEDFLPFAESFAEKLFERPPRAAVMMMVPALREKHEADVEELQRSVQRLSGASRGPATDVSATLTTARLLRGPPASQRATVDDGAGGDEDAGDVQGIEMFFLVNGPGLREVEVTVVIVFIGLRCYVGRYNVRLLPDTRTQIVLDHDTGEQTVVA